MPLADAGESAGADELGSEDCEPVALACSVLLAAVDADVEPCVPEDPAGVGALVETGPDVEPVAHAASTTTAAAAIERRRADT